MLEAEAAPAPEAPAAAPAPPPEAAPAPAAKEESRAERADREGAELDADLRKAYRNAQKERSEDGKYAPKDGETKKVAKPNEAPAPVLDKDGKPVAAKAEKPGEVKAPEAKTPETKPVVAPPKSWKPDVAAKWSNVPPEVQSYIAEREASIQKVASEAGQYKATVETINKLYDRHADRLQGVNRAEHLDYVLRADDMAERDPVGFIKQFAQSKGVDLSTVVPDPYADPQAAQWEAQFRAQQAELQEMRREVQAYRQSVTSQQEAERSAKDAATQKLIADFAADKADFDELQTEIGANARALRDADPTASDAEILKQAYERAQWANPRTRQAIIERQTKEAEAKRIEEAKANADRARRAGSINVRGSAVPVPGAASLEDDLRSIWRKRQAS